MTRLAIGIAAICVTGVALAQPATLGESAQRMIGSWEFSNADRDKVCRFVFRPDTAPGGYKLSGAKMWISNSPIADADPGIAPNTTSAKAASRFSSTPPATIT